MLYLGVDPGRHIGVSLLTHNFKTLHSEVINCEDYSYHEMVQRVLDLIYDTEMSKGEVHVIAESFNLFPHTAREVAIHDNELLTAQIIGALKFNIPEDKITWQIPAMKNGCPDEELKRLGLWLKHGGPEKRHIHDSMRHVVVYLGRK